jgi:hypothetical protein
VDTRSCGASNFYLETTGSHLGRDTISLLMLFLLSPFGSGNTKQCVTLHTTAVFLANCLIIT